MMRSFLGPHRSTFERLKQARMFGRADCGLRWTAVLTGLERIADCTLGTFATCRSQAHSVKSA
eukprot:7123159-Alexandrium_andersonii.AAC.1